MNSNQDRYLLYYYISTSIYIDCFKIRLAPSPKPLRGVTQTTARSHPNHCEESPKPLRGVTPTTARSHPNHCEESPQPLRGVTPTTARSHPNHCEESSQPLWGVTPTTVRSHPNHCEESPQPLRGVTPTTARSHPNHCEESPQPLRGVTQPLRGVAPKVEEWRLTSFFFNNSLWDVIQLRVPAAVHVVHMGHYQPTLKNWQFHLLLFLCYVKCGENVRSYPDRRCYTSKWRWIFGFSCTIFKNTCFKEIGYPKSSNFPIMLYYA